jgi:hypothetical protein
MPADEIIRKTLDRYGNLGTQALKQDVSKVSATGKTAESIRHEVTYDNPYWKLTFYGREFFKALETGRAPRKGNEYEGFDVSMYEYMQARGIGSDLPEKKRKQLAKFLAYRINKEGDKTYKQGGRIVYSNTLTKLVNELIEALKRDVINKYIEENIKLVKAA